MTINSNAVLSPKTPPTKLTDADYIAVSRALGVDVPALKAVCAIEAPKGGFLPNGKPVILFERHIMYRLCSKIFEPHALENLVHAHPDLINPQCGGYTSDEWTRLIRAETIHHDAALQSCSWGKFQIMGMHYRMLGYNTIADFATQMSSNEQAQLEAFKRFIQANPALKTALRLHDWVKFAQGYNGAAFAKNQYDKNLAAAYHAQGGK